VLILKNKMLDFFHWEYGALGLLISIIAALHLSTIFQPGSLVFDEQYYVPAARIILGGYGTTIAEHPPLAQLIIASGIWIFGDNPFGWRIFPVIFGLAGSVFFYLICRRLELDSKYAYVATFLVSFENLSFVQSSVAMLDVFSLTFMLSGFWLYLRSRPVVSGLMIALSMLAKLTGVIAIPIIALHWLIGDLKQRWNIILFLFITLAAFFILMPVLDFLVWHRWMEPFSQVKNILDNNTVGTFAKSRDLMVSRPWEWLVFPVILTYWISPHYLSMISPPVWALIIPAVIFLFFKARQRHKAALFALIWFLGAYFIWVPVSLITDRISYIYYIYPAIGAIGLALAIAAEDWDKHRTNWKNGRWTGIVVPFYLFLCLGAFVILSPVAYLWKTLFCLGAYLSARFYLASQSAPTEGSLKASKWCNVRQQ
jgi:dolichyl-phosphate-mannose-protein mannosyltransferase